MEEALPGIAPNRPRGTTPQTYTPGMVRGGVRTDRSRRLEVRTTILTFTALLAGMSATLAVLGAPYLRFGYARTSHHLVLDSVDG